MARKELKRSPERYEDFERVGPKRAERLREELGPYDEFGANSTNFKRNRLASTVSGNRRNLPKYAENIVQADAEAVDDSLISTTDDGRTVKSKTVSKRREEQADRRDLGFDTQERPDEDFRGAFTILRDEYDDRFDVPAAELGRFARRDDERATTQPLISAASSRVTFAGGAQPDDLRDEIDRAAQNTDSNRAVASPGELADRFTGFIEDKFGFGREVGEFDVDIRDKIRAEERQDERSPEAVRVDNNRRAPVTNDFETWSENPSRFDFAGVDTPKPEPVRKGEELGAELRDINVGAD
jgi:hypothetical protein